MEFTDFIQNLDFTSHYWQICCILIFIVADIVTGYLQALINKNVESKKMREGIIHKMLLIIIVILSFVLDKTFNINAIWKFTSIYIIFMEITSILENVKKAHIDIDYLVKILLGNKKGGKHEDK